jgi:hypothetical protein
MVGPAFDGDSEYFENNGGFFSSRISSHCGCFRLQTIQLVMALEQGRKNQSEAQITKALHLSSESIE